MHISLPSYHPGRLTVLTVIKEPFHVIKINKMVRQIIYKCVICRKVRSRPETQQMDNVSEDRTAVDASPLMNTGTNVFGIFLYIYSPKRTDMDRNHHLFSESSYTHRKNSWIRRR